MTGGEGVQETGPAGIDTSVPHSARVWNYWLGGKDNFPADRQAGDYVIRAWPHIVEAARAQRAFLARVVTHLAGEAGMRQFLDIGTGLPTADNTHQVAQRVAPDARVVYVDNDPLVLAHARALLVGSPEGATDYVDADMRDPDRVLAEAARTLDLDRPVAVLFLGAMGSVADTDEARSIVRRTLAPLAAGSHLALCDGTVAEHKDEAASGFAQSGATPYQLRRPEELASFFDGLELLEPGFVSITRWRPHMTGVDGALPPEIEGYGGVARKP